jgi:predicted chitinase
MDYFKKLKQKENLKKEKIEEIQSRSNYFISFAIILTSIFVIFLIIRNLEKEEVREEVKIEYSEELVTTPEVEAVDGAMFDDQSQIIAEAVVEAENTQPKVETASVKKEVKNPFRNLNNHEKIIAEQCFKLDMSIEETSFVLANANHETAQFKFLEEINGRSQAAKLGYKGGQNWYGRGFIMLTHITNYQQWSKWTGRDLVSDPSILVKDLHLSAFIACSGVKNGSFTATGNLASYEKDWYNARAIVNGDKDYRAGCNQQKCWTVGTKIKDLTNNYIKKIK